MTNATTPPNENSELTSIVERLNDLEGRLSVKWNPSRLVIWVSIIVIGITFIISAASFARIQEPYQFRTGKFDKVDDVYEVMLAHFESTTSQIFSIIQALLLLVGSIASVSALFSAYLTTTTRKESQESIEKGKLEQQYQKTEITELIKKLHDSIEKAKSEQQDQKNTMVKTRTDLQNFIDSEKVERENQNDTIKDRFDEMSNEFEHEISRAIEEMRFYRNALDAYSDDVITRIST